MDFWKLTLRDLDGLYARYLRKREYEQQLVGVIASAVANFSMRAPKNWATPADFGLGPKKIVRKTASREDQQAVMRGWARMWLPKNQVKAEAKDEDRVKGNGAG